MKEEKVYYKKLDYLRIVSCLMVLLYHLNLVKGGFLAVCTFFVLSGYLACSSVLKNKSFSIKKYYFNRLKKIYLPLIIVVFLTVIISKICSYVSWVNLKQETTSTLLGYNNAWQLNAHLDYFTRNADSPFTHLWYISILMQFELLFPLIVISIKKINKKIEKDISVIIVAVLTIIATIFFYIMSKTQDIMAVYYNTFARSFSLLMGVLLALIHFKYNFKIARSFKKFSSLIYGVYTFILIGLCFMVSAESNEYALFMILASIINTRIIEYSTMRVGKRNKKDKTIDMLSKMSYEVYLVQYPVIYFIQNSSIIDALKIPVILALTFGISYFICKLLNSQFKRKTKKLIKVLSLMIVILVGGIITITAKDYSGEMKELEEKLNENSKINEAQNSDYVNTASDDNEESDNNQNKDMEEKLKTTEKESDTTKNSVSKESSKENKNIESEEEVKAKVAEEIKQMPIVGVGDSVLLGVADEMHKVFPNSYIDGKVSRTVLGGRDVLRDLKNQGKLSKTLVLALANNGDYIEKRYKDFLDEFTDKEIFWVDAAGADDPVFNERFKELAKSYPNVHIVEWETITKEHPEYLYADGVHVKGEGIKAYVETVYNTIFETYMEKYK